MELIGVAVMLASFLCLPAALFMPFILEHKRHKKFPETRPYTWGYFTGLILMGTPVMVSSAVEPVGTSLLCFLALFYFPVGFFLLKRKRWAVIAGTFMSCNPVFWLVSGFYFGRRWSEFTAEAQGTY